MSQTIERETRRGSGLRLKRKDKDKDKLQERPSLEQISSLHQPASPNNSTGSLVSSHGSHNSTGPNAASSTPTSPAHATPNLALSTSGGTKLHVAPIATASLATANGANSLGGNGRLPTPPHSPSLSLSCALSQSSLSVNSLSPHSPRHHASSAHQPSPSEPLLSSSSSSSFINSNERAKLFASSQPPSVELSPGREIDVDVAHNPESDAIAKHAAGTCAIHAHSSTSRQALIEPCSVVLPEKSPSGDGVASPLLSPIMSNESISEEEFIPYGSKSQLLTPSKYRDRHSRTDSSKSHEQQPKKLIHLGGLQFDRVVESIDVNGPDEDILNYSFIYDQIQKEPEMTMEDGQMQGSLTAAIRYCVTNSKKVPIRSSNENEKSKGLSAVVHALLWNYELFITSVQLLQIVIIYYRIALVRQSSEREVVESNVFNFIADWILLRFDALEGLRTWKTIFFKFFKLIDKNKTGKPVSEDCLDGPKLFQYWITQRKLYLEYYGSATLPPELFKRDESSEPGLGVSGEISANSNPRSLAPLDPMLIAKQISKFDQIMFLHTSIEEYRQWSTRPTKEDPQPSTASPTSTNNNNSNGAREEAHKPAVEEAAAMTTAKDWKDAKDDVGENTCKHIQAMIDWFNSIVCWVKSTLVVPLYSARERANLVIQWIRVMNAMHELCNYEGILPVYIAVDAILSRDEETNKLIPKDYAEKKAKLRALVGPSNNYAGYRQESNHANLSLPFVPLQCVILKDLVFIEESDNLEEDGSLNWWKFSFIADNLEKLRKAKFNLYNFSEHPEVKAAIIHSYSMRLDSFQLELLIKEKWDMGREKDTLKGMKKHNRSGGTIRLKNLFPKTSLSSQNLRMVDHDGVDSPELEIKELERQATQLALPVDDAHRAKQSSGNSHVPPPITLNAAAITESHDASAINNGNTTTATTANVSAHLIGSPGLGSLSSDSLSRKENKQLLKAGEKASTSSPRLSSKKEKALEREREKQMERERTADSSPHGSSPPTTSSSNPHNKSPRTLAHERHTSLPLGLGSGLMGASEGERSPKEKQGSEKDRSPRREHLILSLPHLHSRSSSNNASRLEMTTSVTTVTEAATMEILTEKQEFVHAREQQQRMLMELQHNILNVTANPTETLVPLASSGGQHAASHYMGPSADASEQKALNEKELLILQLENPFADRFTPLTRPIFEEALKRERATPPLSPHQETTATNPLASSISSPENGESNTCSPSSHLSSAVGGGGAVDLPSSASSPVLKFKKRPTAEPQQPPQQQQQPALGTVKKASSGGKRASESRALQKAASFRDKESPKMVQTGEALSASPTYDENDRCFANQQPMSEFLSRMHSIQLSPGIIAKTGGVGSDEKESKKDKKEHRIILRSSSSDSPTKFKQIEHRDSADVLNAESALARKKLVMDFDNSDGKTLPRRRQSEKHRRLKRDKDKEKDRDSAAKSKLHSSLGEEDLASDATAATMHSPPQSPRQLRVLVSSISTSSAGSGNSSTGATTTAATTATVPSESERSITEGMDDDAWVHLEMQKILDSTVYRTPRDGPLRDSGGANSVRGSSESLGGGEGNSETTASGATVVVMNSHNESGACSPTANDYGNASPRSEELRLFATKKVTRRRTDQL